MPTSRPGLVKRYAVVALHVPHHAMALPMAISKSRSVRFTPAARKPLLAPASCISSRIIPAIEFQLSHTFPIDPHSVGNRSVLDAAAIGTPRSTGTTDQAAGCRRLAGGSTATPAERTERSGGRRGGNERHQKPSAHAGHSSQNLTQRLEGCRRLAMRRAVFHPERVLTPGCRTKGPEPSCCADSVPLFLACEALPKRCSCGGCLGVYGDHRMKRSRGVRAMMSKRSVA